MFGANKVSNVVENAIKCNNVVNHDESQHHHVSYKHYSQPTTTTTLGRVGSEKSR